MATHRKSNRPHIGLCAVESCPAFSNHSRKREFRSCFPSEKGCGWGRNRTADTRIFSPLLCQLSYPAVVSRKVDVEKSPSNVGRSLCKNPALGQALQLP